MFHVTCLACQVSASVKFITLQLVHHTPKRNLPTQYLKYNSSEYIASHNKVGRKYNHKNLHSKYVHAVISCLYHVLDEMCYPQISVSMRSAHKVKHRDNLMLYFGKDVTPSG